MLVRGEPVTAPVGRADNFVWPRSGVDTIREGEPEICTRRRNRRRRRRRHAAAGGAATTSAATARGAPAGCPAAARPQPGQQGPAATAAPKQQPAQPKPKQQPRANNDGMPRPPLGIGGLFR